MIAFSRPFAIDPDVETWAAQVVTNGGAAPSAGFKTQLSWFIVALKSASIYTLIDDMWILVGESSVQALTSFKQLRLATATASPTFTALRGYAFNGTTQYLDTGFICSTHKVAMTGTNMHIAVYERTNVNTNTVAAGCLNFSAQNLSIIPRSTTMNVQVNNASTGATGTTITDSRGLSVGSRNGTLVADVLGYKNGAAITPCTATSVGSTLPTSKLYIGARADNTNAATAFRAATEGFVSVGAAIPAGSQLAFYTAVQNFMASIGANV